MFDFGPLVLIGLIAWVGGSALDMYQSEERIGEQAGNVRITEKNWLFRTKDGKFPLIWNIAFTVAVTIAVLFIASYLNVQDWVLFLVFAAAAALRFWLAFRTSNLKVQP